MPERTGETLSIALFVGGAGGTVALAGFVLLMILAKLGYDVTPLWSFVGSVLALTAAGLIFVPLGEDGGVDR